MQKWEYQVLKRHQSQGGQTFQVLWASGKLESFQLAYPEGGDNIAQRLSTMGGQGWELVSVMFDPDDELIYYFKRPLDNENDGMEFG